MALLDRSLIADLPIFAGLDPQALDEILDTARAHRIARNETLFEQGAEADRFFLVLRGHLRVSKLTPHGEHVLMRFVGPGEICGMGMALGLATYPATAVSAAEAVVLAWPSTAWPRLAEKYPSLLGAALKMVGARLEDTHKRVVEMSTEEVERRVAHAVLRLADQAGRKVEGGVEIDFPITRQDIAAMTGTTLHTVSRILSAWESRGFVEGGRQRIVVRDSRNLLRLADRPPQ